MGTLVGGIWGMYSLDLWTVSGSKRAEWHYKSNAIWDQVGPSSPATFVPWVAGWWHILPVTFSALVPQYSANKGHTCGLEKVIWLLKIYFTLKESAFISIEQSTIFNEYNSSNTFLLVSERNWNESSKRRKQQFEGWTSKNNHMYHHKYIWT